MKCDVVLEKMYTLKSRKLIQWVSNFCFNIVKEGPMTQNSKSLQFYDKTRGLNSSVLMVLRLKPPFVKQGHERGASKIQTNPPTFHPCCQKMEGFQKPFFTLQAEVTCSHIWFSKVSLLEQFGSQPRCSRKNMSWWTSLGPQTKKRMHQYESVYS